MLSRIKYSAGIIWLAAISIAYYTVYPFPEIIAGLPRITTFKPALGLLSPVMVLLLCIVAAAGWGGIFLKKEHIFHSEKFIFSTGLGFGFISIVILIADMAGFVNKYLYFALLVTGAILFLARRGAGDYKLHKHSLILIAISLIPCAGALVGALAPPTQFDSLVYHLALPAKYIQYGGMYPVKESLFFSFPQGMEMLYQLALYIEGDILANLLHWIFLPLVSIGIVSFSRRFCDVKTGLIASAIWSFTPLVLLISTGTYVDIALCYFIFLSVYMFALWHENGQISWLYYSGIFMGIAMGTKYTAMSAAAVLFLIIFLFGGGEKKRIIPALNFLLLTLIVFSPWLIKNTLFLQNPVAPWAGNIFSGSSISQALSQSYFEHIRGHGTAISHLSNLLALPWEITANGFKFGGGFDTLGPLFLLFVPLLFLYRKIDRISAVILLFTIGYCTLWLFTGKVLRFLVPVLPFLSIIAAQGFVSLVSGYKSAILPYAFLCLAMAHNALIFHWSLAPVDPYSPVICGEPRDKYLTRKLIYYNALNRCVNNLPDRSKILFLGETRGYYAMRDCVVPTVFNVNPMTEQANNARNAGELAASLSSENFTHILVNIPELKRLKMEQKLSIKGKDNVKSYFSDFTKPIFSDNNCQVYEIIN